MLTESGEKIMDTYQYKYGDRPLEGYTIQRAAGRGGFGEVYYAISDSGRQVALKVIQSYEQIELRGISQCMNLKNPHLVTVFDVKHNEKGRPFVIMEYVSGPSLSDLIRESPGGLGTQKAAFFLREIGKGLSYLHECGIVHRDLKPSNIFYENGYVKIGDYGLTKAISTSHHVSHTITVGTVHYMAPEVGAGRYDRSIDIYALGILLYEMLTGQVPFFGASPAEILMKHMSAAPDLSNIEEPFKRVICKALAKDPADRYQSVQEMIEDVFGAEHVRHSVSQFAPEELSVVAEHIAEKMHAATPPPQARPQTPPNAARPKDLSKEIGETAERLAKQAQVIGSQFAQKIKTVKERAHQVGRTQPAVADPLSRHQRHKLALIAMAATALGAGFLCEHGDGKIKLAVVVFVMIGLASNGIVRSLQKWWAALDHEGKGMGKVGTVLFASFVAVVVGQILAEILGVSFALGSRARFPWAMRGFPPFGFHGNWFGGTLALALPMLLVDWANVTHPQRQKRVVVGWPMLVGFLGLISGGIFGLHPIVTAATLAGIVLVVQTKSPFGRTVAVGAGAAGPQANSGRAKADSGVVARQVPPYARPLWLLGWLASLGAGLMLLILSGVGNLRGDEFTMAVAFGVDSLILSILCFIMMFRSIFAGWYRYLVRPALLMACVQAVVTASITLGTMNLRGEEQAIALFFIIFPNVLFFVILFLPARLFGAPDVKDVRPLPATPRKRVEGPVSPCKRTTALLLALVPAIPFLPIAGLQRFYVGKIGTGILWLFTGGLLGIGQLIDIIMIAAGSFEDASGRAVRSWDGAEASQARSSARPQPVVAAAAEPAAAWPRPAPVPERQPPAPPQPPSWPSYASSGTYIHEPWDPIGGLLAALGHIFALAAILVGLAIGLHMPAVVAAGWPDPGLADELTRIFGYAEWPGLLENIGMGIVLALLFVAALLIVMGRRRSGPAHLIRAVIGLAGFFFAIQLFRSEAMRPQEVQTVVTMMQQNQIGPGLERLFNSLSQEEAVFSGVIVLISVLLLAWPPRRHTPVFAPMPEHQGVVS